MLHNPPKALKNMYFPKKRLEFYGYARGSPSNSSNCRAIHP